MLAALLCWLDMRHRGGHIHLRLEDLDPQRCRPEFAAALPDALAWLGLDWDSSVLQSTHTAAHHAALDALAARGLLYACTCSRAHIRCAGRPAADGGWAYPNTCRPHTVGAMWRRCSRPLRLRLPAGDVVPVDLGGLNLRQEPAVALGDPIVRRQDGAVAYQLAVVVDDAAAGITDVVRGADIAPSTATQMLLQQLLGLPHPTYRHHLLLREAASGGKLAKLHGSVDAATLRGHLSAAAVCGFLAFCAGLRPAATPCTPAELLHDFTWDKVTRRDTWVRWDGRQLHGAPLER